MAGSFRHVVDEDVQFRGTELLDHLGDAYEALEEMYDMLMWLTDGDKKALYEAWLYGHITKHCPDSSALENQSAENYWAE